eukprot:COSAG04_NODE_1351_length_7119_cov_17.943447_2_plen_1558_part_00
MMWNEAAAAQRRAAGYVAAEPTEPPAATANEAAPSTQEQTLPVGLPAAGSQLRQDFETAETAERADTAAGMAGRRDETVAPRPMVVTPLEMPKEQPMLGADKPAPVASDAAPKAGKESTAEKVEPPAEAAEPAATEERPRDGRHKPEPVAPTADDLTPDMACSAQLVDAAQVGDVETMARVMSSGGKLDLDVLVARDDCTDAGTMEKLPVVRMTALFAAVAQQEEAAVRFLLDRGANPSLADSLGGTPLMTSAANGFLPLLRLLLESKAEVNAVRPQDGATAFHFTCFNNMPDCAEALVRAGCDTSLRTKGGKTGRDLARAKGNTAVLERLDALEQSDSSLEEKAGSEASAKDRLLAAAGRGDCGEVERLIEGGLDINAMSEATSVGGQKMKSTALCQAVRSNQEAAVRFLLDRGANPSLADSRGGTPLMTSGANGFLPLLRLLLESKAEVNAVRPQDGATAFHFACFNNMPDCAEALVRAGCDTGLRTKGGKTGRDLAWAKGNTAVLERLAALTNTNILEADAQGLGAKWLLAECERRVAQHRVCHPDTVTVPAVRADDGKKFTIQVSVGDNLDVIRASVFSELGVAPDQQVLFCSGKAVEHGSQLLRSVRNGGIFFVLVRPRGGERLIEEAEHKLDAVLESVKSAEEKCKTLFDERVAPLLSKLANAEEQHKAAHKTATKRKRELDRDDTLSEEKHADEVELAMGPVRTLQAQIKELKRTINSLRKEHIWNPHPAPGTPDIDPKNPFGKKNPFLPSLLIPLVQHHEPTNDFTKAVTEAHEAWQAAAAAFNGQQCCGMELEPLVLKQFFRGKIHRKWMLDAGYKLQVRGKRSVWVHGEKMVERYGDRFTGEKLTREEVVKVMTRLWAGAGKEADRVKPLFDKTCEFERLAVVLGSNIGLELGGRNKMVLWGFSDAEMRLLMGLDQKDVLYSGVGYGSASLVSLSNAICLRLEMVPPKYEPEAASPQAVGRYKFIQDETELPAAKEIDAQYPVPMLLFEVASAVSDAKGDWPRIKALIARLREERGALRIDDASCLALEELSDATEAVVMLWNQLLQPAFPFLTALTKSSSAVIRALEEARRVNKCRHHSLGLETSAGSIAGGAACAASAKTNWKEQLPDYKGDNTRAITKPWNTLMPLSYVLSMVTEDYFNTQSATEISARVYGPDEFHKVRASTAVAALCQESSGKLKMSVNEFEEHIRPLLQRNELWKLMNMKDVAARLQVLFAGGAVSEEAKQAVREMCEQIEESQRMAMELQKAMTTGEAVVIEETTVCADELSVRWIIQYGWIREKEAPARKRARTTRSSDCSDDSGSEDRPPLGSVRAFVLQLRQEKGPDGWEERDEQKVRLRLATRTLETAKVAYKTKIREKQADLEESMGDDESGSAVKRQRTADATPLLNGRISIDADLTLDGLSKEIARIEDLLLHPAADFPNEQPFFSGDVAMGDQSITVAALFGNEAEVNALQPQLREPAASPGASPVASPASAHPRKKKKAAKKASGPAAETGRFAPVAYPGICAIVSTPPSPRPATRLTLVAADSTASASRRRRSSLAKAQC